MFVTVHYYFNAVEFFLYEESTDTQARQLLRLYVSPKNKKNWMWWQEFPNIFGQKKQSPKNLRGPFTAFSVSDIS